MLPLMGLFAATGIFIFYINPTIYSGENGFILYTISGNFIEPPTFYTHYNYIVNPIISLPLSGLYSWFPKTNWYPLFLVFFSVLAFYIAVNPLLIIRSKPLRLIILAAAYLVFFRIFIQNLEFSFAATLCTIAASIRLILVPHREKQKVPIDWTSVTLILVAISLRPHMLVPVAGVALPFLISRINLKRKIFTLVAAAFLGLILILLQQVSFKRYDPDWAKEEEYRSAVYSIYNKFNSTDFEFTGNKRVQMELVNCGLLIDKNFLSLTSLRELDASRSGTIYRPSLTEVYWLIISNRIYILAWIVTLALLIVTKSNMRRFAISSLILLMGVAGLMLKAKLPPYVIPGGVLLLFLLATGETASRLHEKRITKTVSLAGLLALILFSAFRIVDDRRINKSKIDRFHHFHHLLSTYPGLVFVVVNNDILQGMSAFADPNKFPLRNYLDSEFFLNNTAGQVLKKFGINSINEIPAKGNVVFVGRPDAVVNYYVKHKQISVNLEPVLTNETQWPLFRIVQSTE